MKDSNVISIWKLLLHARRNSKDFFADLFKIKGDVFVMKTPYRDFHFFLNPTCLQHIMFTNRENYTKLPSVVLSDDIAGIVSDYNIITTDNYPIWKKDRETLNPIFTQEYTKKYVSTLVKKTQEQLEGWNDFVTQKKPINIDHATSLLAYENSLATLFGGISHDFEEVHTLARKVLKLVSSYMYLSLAMMGVLPTFLASKHKRLAKNIESVLDEIIDKCLSPSAQTDNIIKILYDANKDSVDETELRKHLRANTLTFLMAGHETLSTLLCWTFTYLSLYPNTLEKVYAEIKSIVGSREPTYEDIEKLKYTRAFLDETLRLQPPFGTVFRTAVKDDRIGSNKIKSGDIIVISTLFMQRLPLYWPNPEGFQPERFLEPLPDEYKFIYIPFGAGPRSCIGQHFAMLEAMIILVLVSQRFRLSLLPGFTIEREEGLPMGKLKIDVEMMVLNV